jgi:hypothetical protein
VQIWRVHRIATHAKTQGEDKIKVNPPTLFDVIYTEKDDRT